MDREDHDWTADAKAELTVFTMIQVVFLRYLTHISEEQRPRLHCADVEA